MSKYTLKKLNQIKNYKIYQSETLEGNREDDHKVADSNFGVGIDATEPDFIDMIKFNFEK